MRALLLLVPFLAGCSDGDSGGQEDVEPQPDVLVTEEDDNLTTPVAPEPLPPREVYNESFDFPQLPDDAAISDSFDIVDGEEVRLSMASTAECPVYWGNEDPGIVFTSPSGREIVLIDFGGSSGDQWSGICNGAAPEFLGTDAQETFSERGTWQIASRGQFRGSVEIAVVLDPAT